MGSVFREEEKTEVNFLTKNKINMDSHNIPWETIMFADPKTK